MKTIIKDLTGEMPVESIDGKINDILNQFDTRKDCSGWGDAVAAIKSLFADKPKGKPIEFVIYINPDGSNETAVSSPKEFAEVKCIGRSDKANKYDLFEAIMNNGDMFRYLGHWNGGYVECNS